MGKRKKEEFQKIFLYFFETLLEKHMGDKKIRKNIILYIVV